MDRLAPPVSAATATAADENGLEFRSEGDWTVVVVTEADTVRAWSWPGMSGVCEISDRINVTPEPFGAPGVGVAK